MHALENRVAAGDVAERQEIEQRRRMNRRRLIERGEDRLGLGAEQKLVAMPAVIQRLLADTIAREDQALLGGVPDRDGEHAAHALERADPFRRVKMRDHFRVAGRGGVSAARLRARA